MRNGTRPWLSRLAVLGTVSWLPAVLPASLSSPPARFPRVEGHLSAANVRSFAAPPVATVKELNCLITADGNSAEWPAGTQLLTTALDPQVTSGLLCVRHVNPAAASPASDTLYLFLLVSDNSSTATDSVIFIFDTNRDQILGSEDRGVRFRRGGAAAMIDGTRTSPLGALSPVATGANCVLSTDTRICIFNTAAAWRVEAKLVPSDFGMTTFAGTVGAFLDAFNVGAGSSSTWPSGLDFGKPDTWVPLKLGTPNYRFCFRDIINTPDAFTVAPVIDGTVSGDNGWTSAWRYVFHSGVVRPDVVVQGIKNASSIYLSFEVSNDADFNPDDLLLIAFDPTGAVGDEWHLGIKPLIAGGVNPTISKEHWTGSTFGTSDAAPNVVVAAKTGIGTTHPWSVEVEIPRTDIPGLPTATDFGFYVAVHRTVAATATTSEFPWPTEKNATMGANEHVFPDTANWGRATLAAVSCNGVSVAPDDIATNNLPPNKIALTGPNTFKATVHNSSIAGNGSFIPAPNVTARFKIANFGLPSSMSWLNVPADAGTPNPTPPTTIPANSSATLSFKWTLNTTEQGQYNTPLTDHQCILVELDAAGAPATMTTFSNKSAWTNMEFGTASTFESFAVVDGRGYGPPPSGRAGHVFQLTTERMETTFVQPPDKTPESGRRRWRPFSQLTYLVHGCLLSGRQIYIGRRIYNVCERVGSFGYVISHEGATAPEWRVSLRGKGLVKPAGESENRFSLMVPPDSQVPLHVVIAAGPRGIPLWVWLAIVLILLLLLAWKIAKARR